MGTARVCIFLDAIYTAMGLDCFPHLQDKRNVVIVEGLPEVGAVKIGKLTSFVEKIFAKVRARIWFFLQFLTVHPKQCRLHCVQWGDWDEWDVWLVDGSMGPSWMAACTCRSTSKRTLPKVL